MAHATLSDLPTIVILPRYSHSEQALRTALAGAYHLYVRHSDTLVLDALRHGIGNLVIIELLVDGMRPITRVVEHMRVRYPRLPILGYFSNTPRLDVAPIIAVATSAGMMAVIRHERDDIRAAVRAAIAPSPWHTFVESFRSELDAIPSVSVRQFCEYALAHAITPITMTSAAEALHTNERSLVAAFRASRMRPPRWFLARARLLAAVSLLDGTRRRVEDVAVTFGYPSGGTLRRALAREIGLGAREFQGGGAYERLTGVIRAALRAERDTAGLGHPYPGTYFSRHETPASSRRRIYGSRRLRRR